MAIRMPKTLKNFNVFIEGEGFAGVATEIQLPNIEVNEDDHRAGGMDMPRSIDMGLSKLEVTVTLTEVNATVMKTVAVHDGSNKEWKAYGALNDDESTSADPTEVIMRGKVTKHEPSAYKSGEKTEDKFTLALKYYKYSVKGDVVYEIDNDNLKRLIGGEDQMESIRSAIKV